MKYPFIMEEALPRLSEDGIVMNGPFSVSMKKFKLGTLDFLEYFHGNK